MAETAFRVIGLTALTKSLASKSRKLDRRGGLGGPFHRAVIFLDGWIQRNFKGEGKLAMGGSGWKPLAPSTIRAREMGWGYYKPKTTNPQILKHKGFLMRRWKHDYNDRRAVIENWATSRGFYYGTAHDGGLGHLPERRILPKKEQVQKEINKIFGNWIKTSLK